MRKTVARWILDDGDGWQSLFREWTTSQEATSWPGKTGGLDRHCHNSHQDQHLPKHHISPYPYIHKSLNFKHSGCIRTSNDYRSRRVRSISTSSRRRSWFPTSIRSLQPPTIGWEVGDHLSNQYHHPSTPSIHPPTIGWEVGQDFLNLQNCFFLVNSQMPATNFTGVQFTSCLAIALVYRCVFSSWL